MSVFKEIVTKAIIGKGKKYFKDNYSIDVENKPTTILGCWVINHLLVDGDDFIEYY